MVHRHHNNHHRQKAPPPPPKKNHHQRKWELKEIDPTWSFIFSITKTSHYFQNKYEDF